MSMQQESAPDTATLQAMVRSLRDENEHLKLLVAKLQRMQFGRRSEVLNAEDPQCSLSLGGQITPLATPPPQQPVEDTARGKPSRKPLPAHLPREVQRHTVDAHRCPDCGGPLRSIGEDVSEVLEYVPARFKVIRHVRPKAACTGCHKLVQASAPERSIARSLAGPGLLAQVMVSKYCDYLPLYRQSQIYARDGVDLPRSTLADWVRETSRLLSPLVEALRCHTLAGTTLHADDTPVPVLSPGKGRTKTGRLWTYVRDERPAKGDAAPSVWFAYSPDRKGQHPGRHLATYQGAVHADGYAGFNRLFESGQRVDVACWAHVRRKFYEIHQAQVSPLAATALDYIQHLYRVESAIRGRPPDERTRWRRSRAGPILDELFQWLQSTLAQVSRKSMLAEAIRYALARWTALTRYRDDGCLEIDNNAAERALRAVALGRKNYLFLGSDKGGERAAALYSLIGTARLNGLDPLGYLRGVLSRITTHPINRIDELLPWNVVQDGDSITDDSAAA
jgi:transposase